MLQFAEGKNGFTRREQNRNNIWLENISEQKKIISLK